MAKSQLEELIDNIKVVTKANTDHPVHSQNVVDEVNVMKTMLNDKDFSIGVYDKNEGYIGQRCPHDEAVKFVKNIVSGATGLDQKDSQCLAENYEFTKKDATFVLDTMRDFVSVYSDTGRKLNILQTDTAEAYIFTKAVPATTKSVPDKDNPGSTKQITTSPYTKLVSLARCPRYNDSSK
jgi:hypothetical protein